MACIYRITNLINGKFYIGSTKTELSKRKTIHLSQLRRNVHYNPHLQYSFNKYGEENFEFSIVNVVIFDSSLSNKENNSKLREKELELIISLNPQYNVNRTTISGSFGRNLSQEDKMKISKTTKGRKRTPEAIENIRKGKLGVKLSQKRIDDMRIRTLNKPIHSSRPICVFNLNNELIAEYDFQGQAARAMKIRKTSISNNANGRQATAGGYIFKFK